MGEVVNPDNQERIKTQPNMIQTADFSLTISDVQLSDEGSYQCTLYDSKSIKMIYTIKLKVHREKGGTPSTPSTASTEPPLSVQSAPLQSATPLGKCSVTGPPSLQLTVIVIAVCVTFLLLGPLLFLYCRYKLLLQRITSLSSNDDDVQDSNLRPRRNEEHIYTEIIARNNTNIVANSLSGDENEEDYEREDYENLSRATRSKNGKPSNFKNKLLKAPRPVVTGPYISAFQIQV
ncbi:hypothetical protein HHUSO_G23879 [Huso huso]|uniref:Immunoglobulin V-set domain-containing protein n=1 Tax=Huso huso TaxID=61971 RepID=A0ABR0YTJ7_HUSHU